MIDPEALILAVDLMSARQSDVAGQNRSPGRDFTSVTVPVGRSTSYAAPFSGTSRLKPAKSRWVDERGGSVIDIPVEIIRAYRVLAEEPAGLAVVEPGAVIVERRRDGCPACKLEWEV